MFMMIMGILLFLSSIPVAVSAILADIPLPIKIIIGCLIVCALIAPIGIILTARQYFSIFYIDERGITNKLWFKEDIFIAWDEFTYIGVSEIVFVHRAYHLCMYFSKIPLSNKQLTDAQTIPISKDQFYVAYKKGLLEEVLKYVDERKIKNIDLIKETLYPHRTQWLFYRLPYRAIDAITKLFKNGKR